MTISLTSNHWLITGGCGFIGSSLIATLLKEYPEVQITVLDNFSVGTRDDLHEAIAYFNKGGYHNFGNIELIEGNIKDYDTCCQCSEGVDVIVHLAANTGVAPSVENPRRDMEVNLIGTFNMLEAARQNNVKKFIFASSGAAIGEVEPPIDEEKVQKPVSPYGASKLAGEAYCSSYFRTFGINTVSLRFGNVYGPLSKHKSSVVAKFLRQAFSGETLEIYGDGSQTRDFIYIDDLIRAIILSVNSNLGGEVFQIATYKETTVSEIAKKIKNLIENDRGKKINIIHGVPRRGDVKRNYSDISKAKRMIGFSPRVRLDKGLESTFEYFRTKLRE